MDYGSGLSGPKHCHKAEMTDNSTNTIAFYDLQPESEDFGDALIDGLSQPAKSLPCKFFYDKRGSEIFDQICELEEYYVTRTEIALLNRHAGEMVGLSNDGSHLIEFGSGSSIKVGVLLRQKARFFSSYTAIDISRDHLIESSERLSEEFPELPVSAVCADYTKEFEFPLPLKEGETRTGFFPGSSIGNFDRQQAGGFLGRVAGILGPESGFLLGIDLKKDPKILHAAYNDKAGITAEFNLNLLHRANRELGTNFDLAQFDHDAVYNETEGRIEMYLVSKINQSVNYRGLEFHFLKDERVHTENSYKYSLDEVTDLAAGAGFAVEKSWVDDNQLFGVHFLKAEH